MSIRIARLAGCVVLALLPLGCDKGGGDDGGDETDPRGCEAETRDDEYQLGMEKAGAQLLVRFVDADPAPPDRGDNTWTIEVLDLATGEPADDVTLEVEPYMPDHKHGSSIQCNVTEMPEPGELQLAPVNLFMPGLWQVQLHFTRGETTDRVDFNFCVDP
jgi:hypothetical protein